MEKIFGGKLSKTSINKIKDILNSQKPDENPRIIKKVITLFFQPNPIQDFDPVEQFNIIKNIKISQQYFCQLLSEVVFKVTQNLFLFYQNFNSFLKSSKKESQKSEQIQKISIDKVEQNRYQNDSKSQYIVQTSKTILCGILTKLRTGCSRLQQLIYRMIDIHDWKCQQNKNCSGTYLQGHVAKVLFKKMIATNLAFQKQIQSLKIYNQQKQLRFEGRTELEALLHEVEKWGLQLIRLVNHKKEFQVNFDKKASSQIKYFICESCYYSNKLHSLQEIRKISINKQKKKRKKKSNDTSQISQNISRKNSTFSIEQKSTNDEIDQDFKSQEDKDYQRIYNFLQNLEIDKENRIEIRLKLSQSDEQTCQTEGTKSLRRRIKTILYKNFQ